MFSAWWEYYVCCNSVCVFQSNTDLPDSDKDDVDKDTIDNFHGTTKDQFTNFEKKLSEKISEFESSPHYESFLENHFRNCCLGRKFIHDYSAVIDDISTVSAFLVNAESLKKIVSSLTVLQNEKSKQERVGYSFFPKIVLKFLS